MKSINYIIVSFLFIFLVSCTDYNEELIKIKVNNQKMFNYLTDNDYKNYALLFKGSDISESEYKMKFNELTKDCPFNYLNCKLIFNKTNVNLNGIDTYNFVYEFKQECKSGKLFFTYQAMKDTYKILEFKLEINDVKHIR